MEAKKLKSNSVMGSYTDREIFQGLVLFFNGPVASNITYINNNLKLSNFSSDQNFLDDVYEVTDAILDSIEAILQVQLKPAIS